MINRMIVVRIILVLKMQEFVRIMTRLTMLKMLAIVKLVTVLTNMTVSLRGVKVKVAHNDVEVDSSCMILV